MEIHISSANNTYMKPESQKHRRDSAFLSLFFAIVVSGLLVAGWVLNLLGVGNLFLPISVLSIGMSCFGYAFGLIGWVEAKSKEDSKGQWWSYFGLFVCHSVLSLFVIWVLFSFVALPMAAILATIFLAVGYGALLIIGAPVIRFVAFVVFLFFIVAAIASPMILKQRVNSRKMQVMDQLRKFGMGVQEDHVEHKNKIMGSRKRPFQFKQWD